MTLLHPPTPIPSPQWGRGGSFRPASRFAPAVWAGRLPPPSVGEGRGGGASRRKSFDRRAA
jgi:hypothetical protein